MIIFPHDQRHDMPRSLLIALILLAARALPAQTADTTRISPADTVIADSIVENHARNRLLWMSTGETAEKGSGWFGVHELVIFQGGYAPTDFLQINVLVMPFVYGFAAIGVKARVLPGDGLFRGLSVGGDIGTTIQSSQGIDSSLVVAYNIAASFGSDIIAAHLNLTSASNIFPGGRVGIPNLAQLGVSLGFSNDRKIKLMAEGWFVNSNEPGEPLQPEFVAGAAGVRVTNKHFVWELGGFLISGFSFSGHGSGSDLVIPYVSGVWYF
jgi:hypothetical protein